MSFNYWLEQKFIEWMAQEKQRKTLTAFAEYVGVSQSLMTRYMNGQMLPTGDNIHKIASRLGPEVYNLLGLVPPDPDLQRINAIWHKLPPEVQRSIRSQVEKYQTEDDEQTIPALKQNPSNV